MQTVFVNAQYAVVVQLGDIVVSTPTNRLADGSCCVSSQSPPLCTSCPNLRIRLCARVDSHDTSDTDINNCTLGSTTIYSSFNRGTRMVASQRTVAWQHDTTYTVSSFEKLFSIFPAM